MKPKLRVVQPNEYPPDEERPFNGKRLQQVRQLRRLSVADLASDLEVLPMEIELYESGNQQPTGEMEFAISQRLDFPEAFFHREDPPPFGRGSLDWH